MRLDGLARLRQAQGWCSVSGVKRYPPIHEFDGAEFVKASDFDALTQQLAASEARRKVLEGDDCWGDAALTVKLERSEEKVSELQQQLAARDKQLSKAVFLLKEAWKGAEDGEVPRVVKAFLTTIEQAKEND